MNVHPFQISLYIEAASNQEQFNAALEGAEIYLETAGVTKWKFEEKDQITHNCVKFMWKIVFKWKFKGRRMAII